MHAQTLAEIIDAIRDARGPAPSRAVASTMREAIGCDDLSVCLTDPAGPSTVLFSTSRPAAELTRLQLELGEGPCIDPPLDGTPEAPTADPTATPWPRLAALAFRRGVTAIAGVPLVVDGERVGSLCLQWRSRFAIDPAVLDDAFVLARAVAPALLRHRSALAS